MQRFDYSAFDPQGNKTSGYIDAISHEDAVKQIQQLQLQPITIKAQSKRLQFGRHKKPGLSELEYFTKEMKMLLEAGIRIDKAVGIMARNQVNQKFASLLNNIHKDIKQGIPLHKALAAHPGLFSPLYCNMVAIGEASGNLPEVFSALSDDLTFKSAVRKKTIQALTYPAVIAVVCILCLYFVFTFIVPQMSGIFDNVATLPWYTEMILAVSDWMVSYDIFFLLGLLLFGFVVGWLHNQGELDESIQYLQLNLPVLKALTKLLESMRFNASMALMMNAGLRLDKALSLAIGSLKHKSYIAEIKQASESIRKGSLLSQTLANTRIYDDIYHSLLEIGEESGNLDKTFQEIAERQKSAFEDWTSRMTALLEPLLIVFMGLVVGGVVVIMLMSMVTVNDVSF